MGWGAKGDPLRHRWQPNWDHFASGVRLCARFLLEKPVPSRRKTDFSVFCRLGPSRGCIKAATKQFFVDWDCRLGWVVFSFVDWTCWILFPIPPIIRLGCKKNPPCRSQIKSHTTLCTAGAAAPGALENNGEGVSGASVRRGVGRM